MRIPARHFKRLFAVFLLLVVLYPKNSFAGPPFATDDPVPVDYKHTEIYVASTYTRDKGGSSGSLPLFDMNYGLLPDLHIHAATPFNYNREKMGEEDEEGELHRARTQYGYGDTELGFKWRLIHEKKWIPQVAVYPAVELTTGSAVRGLGAQKTQVFLPVWLQKSWGKWSSYGGGGCWFNPGVGNKNWLYLGDVLQREISEWLAVGGEINYRTLDAVGGQSGLGLNFGGQINLTQNHHLLASAGTDAYGPRHFTSYLAYQLTF